MRRLLPMLLLLALAPGPAPAEVVARDVRLMIGGARSVVRELREITFTSEVSEVVLEGLPATADLTTLQVGSSRQGITLQSWQRVPAEQPASTGLVWRSGQPLRPVPEVAPGAAVRCRLETASLRTRWIEVVYQMEGLAWRADYEITIRGDIANHLEPLSLDLVAHMVISNTTGRAFPDARVLLVGRDQTAEAEPGAPGVLMLDDWSPLADLWRSIPAEPGLTYDYPLEKAVDVPALGEATVRLAATRRQPAERLYSMQGEGFSTSDLGPGRELTRFLVMRNDSGHGLGMPLPPGEALIYLGGPRGAAYQQARLSHTKRNDELRIRLGTARGVTASRFAEARTPGTAGLPEQTITLKLANTLPTAVNVEVVERPPVPLAWDMVRSSSPYERRGQRLFFSLQVKERSEADITYTVRLSEPAP